MEYQILICLDYGFCKKLNAYMECTTVQGFIGLLLMKRVPCTLIALLYSTATDCTATAQLQFPCCSALPIRASIPGLQLACFCAWRASLSVAFAPPPSMSCSLRHPAARDAATSDTRMKCNKQHRMSEKDRECTMGARKKGNPGMEWGREDSAQNHVRTDKTLKKHGTESANFLGWARVKLGYSLHRIAIR